MDNYIFKSVARPYIRKILRELKEKGYPVVYSWIDWGNWHIIVKYVPGQELPKSVNAKRFKYVAGRGSWRKKRVLAEPTITYSSDSIAEYIKDNFDSENLSIIDPLRGAMSLYDNTHFGPRKNIIPVSKKTSIGEVRTYIWPFHKPEALVKKIKRIVRERKLKKWKIFVACSQYGAGALILK